MDNASGHSPDLEDTLLKAFSFATEKFLSANTEQLIQFMDLNVISNFKKQYTKEMFQSFFEVTSKRIVFKRVQFEPGMYSANASLVRISARTFSSISKKKWN